ncbi:MAG: hypothetical protein NTV52_34490, partial [Acidobacteria bacterium]|nr:hypothetical protein [Acidobacteriota bacterium]
PRVGNWEFVARYNTLGLSDRTKRYVHDQDGIAIVPPAVLYSHVCEPIRIPDYSILGSRIIPPPAPTVPAIQRINPLAKVSPPPAPAGLAPQRPATLFSLVAMIPSFAPIAWFFYQMVVADPDSRWNPERTTLGKNSLLGGYIIFALPMLAALTITKFEWFSTGLATLLQSIPWLFWLCAALGFLMAQQIGYQLLFAIPKWPRLALSLMLASLLAFWIPQLALLANILVLLSASGLVLIYFVLGGGADHPMEHYLRELGGRTTRTFCSVESAEGVEQFVAAQLSFARNHPQAAAKVADFLKNMKGK